MDKKKIKEELQEIKLELAYIRGMLTNLEREVSPKPPRVEYEHPWYAYKRDLVNSVSED